MRLRQLRFKDFITLQRGFDLPKSHRSAGPFAVVASTSMEGRHKEFKVRPPGVVTGRSGSLGVVQYLDEPFWPLNTTLWVKDFKGNNPRYVYYFLQTIDLEKFNSGAGVPTLNRNHLATLSVLVHSSESQRKIAAILSAYDHSIEINTRRSQILHAMALLVFDEWLAKYRFPGHQAVKTRSSPLGPIPQGWTVGSLGDHLLALETGKRPQGGATGATHGVPSIGAENIKALGVYDYAVEKYVPRDYFSEMRKGVVRDRDVALYKDGAYIGRSSYFRDGFPHQECCVNEHVFLLRADGKRLTQNILYLWLRLSSTIHAIRATNANAAQPGINQDGLRGVQIVLPSEPIAARLDTLVEPILAEIANAAKRNRTLQRTRDFLLPRLIAGEIDVDKVEIPPSTAEAAVLAAT